MMEEVSTKNEIQNILEKHPKLTSLVLGGKETLDIAIAQSKAGNEPFKSFVNTLGCYALEMIPLVFNQFGGEFRTIEHLTEHIHNTQQRIKKHIFVGTDFYKWYDDPCHSFRGVTTQRLTFRYNIPIDCNLLRCVKPQTLQVTLYNKQWESLEQIRNLPKSVNTVDLYHPKWLANSNEVKTPKGIFDSWELDTLAVLTYEEVYKSNLLPELKNIKNVKHLHLAFNFKKPTEWKKIDKLTYFDLNGLEKISIYRNIYIQPNVKKVLKSKNIEIISRNEWNYVYKQQQ